MSNEPVFKQLDQVQILTTQNVEWMSGPSGHAAKPHGVWSVVGILGTDLLISRQSTLVRIPYVDVKKVASYDPKAVLTRIKELTNGQKDRSKSGTEQS